MDVKCSCQHCKSNIVFESQDVGRTVACPHCNMETILHVPPVEVIKPPVLELYSDANQAAQYFESISDSQKPERGNSLYTVILSPGIVRYLKPEHLWEANLENVISGIGALSDCPEIKTPLCYFGKWTKEDSKFHDRHDRLPNYRHELTSFCIDQFLEGETWENKLRVHHSFGQYFNALPSHIYSYFHRIFKLGKKFHFNECVKSWVAEATENIDLAESFKKSPKFFVEIADLSQDDDDSNICCYVFKKTDFVKERLAIIEKEDEEQSVAEDTERLRKSGFSNFIYIMHDFAEWGVQDWPQHYARKA